MCKSVFLDQTRNLDFWWINWSTFDVFILFYFGKLLSEFCFFNFWSMLLDLFVSCLLLCIYLVVYKEYYPISYSLKELRLCIFNSLTLKQEFEN